MCYLALRCAADLARREAAIDYEQNLSAGERPAAAPFGAEAADSAAMLAEGKRLLVGRGAPFAPQQGAALVREAAGLGNADALCLAATLFGAGAWTQQSWSDALDLLVMAAERGSADAREQLAIIAGHRGPDGAPAGHWRELRRRIDLEAFVQPPPRAEISQSPRVWTARGFADAATCRHLVRRAQGKLKPAQMYNRRTQEQSYDAMRTNSDFMVDIVESGMVLLLLRIRMSLLVSLPVPHMEPPQVLHYLPGQELKAHYDFITDEAAGARLNDRAATFLLALNDDYDGGETEFLRTGLRWRGQTGDALFFANLSGGQPDKMSLHAGKPIARGEKYLLSQWIRSAPYAI